MIRLARVYDAVTAEDGVRVLADRLWPRGLHRDDPRVGRWDKEVAPSTDLRHWYGHQAARYAEFARRYRDELAAPGLAAPIAELRALATHGPLTLVTATRELGASHLGVLKEVLEQVTEENSD